MRTNALDVWKDHNAKGYDMAQTGHYQSELGKKAADVRDRAAEQFDKAADNVEGMVKSISDRGREVGEDVQAVAGNIKSAVDTSIKDQPMATLAIAAAVGFVLGALWKS